MRTTYKLLKDFPLICGFKIEIVPTGTIIVNDTEVMHSDGYMARFDLPPIPKLVVENNPDFFEEVKEKRKPREWYEIEFLENDGRWGNSVNFDKRYNSYGEANVALQDIILALIFWFRRQTIGLSKFVRYQNDNTMPKLQYRNGR